MTDRYNFSLTTFSPSGKLVQIEYALNAVNQGFTSVPMSHNQTVPNGVVIATEKKTASILIDETSLEKVSVICPTVGAVFSGMSPDARLLVAKARKAAQKYFQTYQEYPPVSQLVREIASVMQEYTQSGGVRPFGVSMLVAGFDETGGPALYQVDPSGSYFAWKASAIGKNMSNAKAFLEKRYDPAMELDDAVHTAIITLKEGFEGQLDENNIEVGVFDYKQRKFSKLSAMAVKDFIANI